MVHSAKSLNTAGITKKVALTQAIRSMRELYPEEYDFYPRSWVLPPQLTEFQDYCRELEASSPDGGEPDTVRPCFIVKVRIACMIVRKNQQDSRRLLA